VSNDGQVNAEWGVRRRTPSKSVELAITNVVLSIVAVVVSALAGVSAWWLLGTPSSGIDDADITMIYARNLASGFGYVYRPFGERVEGSTSLLWTLICTIWFATKPASFASLFVLVGVFNSATAFSALVLVRRMGAGLWGVIATALLFGAAAGFHCWSAGTLMDVSLWSTLVTVTFVALVRPFARAGTWLVAIALVGLVAARPEGLVLAPAGICLHLAFSWLSGETPLHVVRRTCFWLAVFALAVVAITSFRVQYFGYPFPNTFYAKVGADRLYNAVSGLNYVTWFLRTSPLSILVATAVAYELVQLLRMLMARRRSAGFRPELPALLRSLIAVEIALGFSLRLIEGADHFAGHRTLQPFVPLGTVLVVSSAMTFLQSVRVRHEQFTMPLLVTACALAIPGEWCLFAHGPAKNIRGEYRLAKHQREVGLALMKVFPDSNNRASLGVVAAGGIAFTYDGPVYDLLGLNWTDMAHGSTDRIGQVGHAAFSPDVFWKTPIAIVLPDKRKAKPNGACDLFDKWYDSVLRGLIRSARFRKEYRPALVELPDGFLQFFVQRQFSPAHAARPIEYLEWPATFPNEC
jgi:arabinofuranosyltransferase